MYHEHPEIAPIPNETVLWRYMDFTKFVSLLDTKSLFFSRVDQLGDPFEGSVSIVNHRLRPNFWKKQGLSPEDASEFSKAVSEDNRRWTQNIVVNCWHENENESEAMWKLYGGNSGIAIKSMFKGLSESFSNTDKRIYVGRIRYVEYNETFIGESHAFLPSLYKRKSFEHENEVRAITTIVPPDETGMKNYIQVDLLSLVDNIIVAPYAQDWFFNLVKSVAERYGLQSSVWKSEMDAEPVW